VDSRELRRERKQEQVREEILAATRRVLLEKGLGGFTLTAVARKLQLTKAALYHYFPSKEALVSELMYRDMDSHATAVEEAINGTNSGADALEALIRAAAKHYSERMDALRLTYMLPQVGAGGATLFDAEGLQRIRPFNERMYGSVNNKIRQDQETGKIAKDIDGRRLAFVAHVSVLGVLTIEGLVESAGDVPIIHKHDAMVEDLVCSFRARLAVTD
jgi:AcrR family transcriptional regulator